MKERPILFSGEMVRAIFDGRKTQTRRILKPQPIGIPKDSYCDPYNKNYDHFTFWTKDNKMCLPKGNVKIKGKETAHWRCPYGQPGDRLIVRETFAVTKDANGFPYIIYKASSEIDDSGERDGVWFNDKFFPNPIKWRPAIHIPLLSSRIKLEITNVRVERLQDISEEDAKAEGVAPLFTEEETRGRPEFNSSKDSWRNYLWHGAHGKFGLGNKKSDAWKYQYSGYKEAKGSFSSLWESINGSGAWEENKWVWVISFRRINA